MKSLKLSIVLSLLFFLGTALLLPKGFLYKSDEGKMSVEFPGEFTTERVNGENQVTIKAMCTFHEQTYFASYSLHQVELADKIGLANSSFNTFIKTVEGQLTSKSAWVVLQNTGVRAVMELPNNVHVEYRVVLVGNIQYQMVSLAPDNQYDAMAAESFFDSFKLLK